MSLQKYVESHLQIHTLRIELTDGLVLLYSINADVKEDLQKRLGGRTQDQIESHDVFLCFYSISDRMVFIKIKAIRRLIFCWDPISQVQSFSSYHDNFLLAVIEEEQLFIPDLIIKLRGSTEPLIYSDLDQEDDFLGIDEESFTNMHFRKGGFLTVPDEDGEQNYIPVINIECIEVSRKHIYPDDIWKEMQDLNDTMKNLN